MQPRTTEAEYPGAHQQIRAKGGDDESGSQRPQGKEVKLALILVDEKQGAEAAEDKNLGHICSRKEQTRNQEQQLWMGTNQGKSIEY